MQALLIEVGRQRYRLVQLPPSPTSTEPVGAGVLLASDPALSRYDGGHLILSTVAAPAHWIPRIYCPGRWWHGYAGRVLVCGVGRRRRLMGLTHAEIRYYYRHLIFQTGPSSEWSRPRKQPNPEPDGQTKLLF